MQYKYYIIILIVELNYIILLYFVIMLYKMIILNGKNKIILHIHAI